jgi:NADPH-ferrihemoprotein reductase
MSTKEGKVEYREKIVDAHVGIADIVTKLCTSIVCPLEHFIMICPRLQPRYYTISSSSLVNPTTIHITLAVLETTTKDGRVFRGLTSNYLANTVNIGNTVSAFVRESTFRLKDQSRPLLMFGPGTGIAPMRAFLQERSYMRNTTEEVVGPSILYFGCKKRAMDYIYRDELEAFVNEGTLTQLHLAFSREKKEKVYVQHLLVSNAVETWKLIQDDKASIFVCGAVRMGADVGSALLDIIADQGGMSREKAKAYLDSMAVAGRYVQELWS